MLVVAGAGFGGGLMVVLWWLMVVLVVVVVLVFVVVLVVASHGYVLWIFFYKFVVYGVFKYMGVRRCGLFKVRLHESLIDLIVIFMNGVGTL